MHPVSKPPTARAPSAEGPALYLLGPFRARRDGASVDIAHSSARVLAYLAVHGAASRTEVSGLLWPETSQARASSDLRTALWRLQRSGSDFLDLDGQTLVLAARVTVDIWQATEWATAVVSGAWVLSETPRPPPGCDRELLRGWDEPWLDYPREELRMLTVQAFELVAERLIGAGRPAEALPYLLQAMRIDPVRESTAQLMVELHLLQHNVHEAVRQYRRYRDLARQDLGIEPSIGLRSLLSRYLAAE
jgi:DNA-binding SARP family transcriptional activator